MQLFLENVNIERISEIERNADPGRIEVLIPLGVIAEMMVSDLLLFQPIDFHQRVMTFRMHSIEFLCVNTARIDKTNRLNYIGVYLGDSGFCRVD